MSDSPETKKPAGYKRWVAVFAIVGIAVHVGVFYLFNLNLKEPPIPHLQEGFVYYLPEALPLSTDELEQRAYLFDSVPIFLPTTRNYSGPIKTDASVWEPDVSLAAAFDKNIGWDDSLLIIEPDKSAGSSNPIEFLKTVPRDFVSEFGAVSRNPVKPAPKGLFVEAKSTDGRVVLKTFIELDSIAGIDFPLNPEFAVFFTDYGLAGEPLLISPSGNEVTDNFVREFILRKVHPILLGFTGYFHIRIGL